jgi:hypothetical protein
MESEYMAASEAASEGFQLRKFVIELGVFLSMFDHVDILCDNTAAIANISTRVAYKQTCPWLSLG